MITPLFSVTQSDKTLLLKIRAPHTRPRDIQLRVDGPNFHFYTSPYLLHLRFEHSIHLPLPDHPTPVPPNTSYDLDTGTATITLHKLPPYPHFARLDMLSTLLVARTQARQPPSIQVLSTSSPNPSEQDLRPMHAPLSASGLLLPLRELSLGRPRYGFAARYEAVFTVRADDVSQILELRDPDSVPVWRRASLRRAAENAKFSPDHYIADFLEPDVYAHVLRYRYTPPHPSVPLPDHLTDFVLKLPRRAYLPEVDTRAAADLAGLLFAVMYDTRVTEGERSVESAWTVSRLCASMAFLEAFKAPREAIVAAYRRSLAYPLYRACAVAEAVLRDLKALFEEGEGVRSRVFRVLVELTEIFEADVMLRLHCDLFLIDYCVWIQNVDEMVLDRLRADVLAVEVGKEELGWGLGKLETIAVRMANGEVVELKEKSSDSAKEKGGDESRRGAENALSTPGEIRISALSEFPASGLEMNPIATRKTRVEEIAVKAKIGDMTESSCYDSDSSEDSELSSLTSGS